MKWSSSKPLRRYPPAPVSIDKPHSGALPSEPLLCSISLPPLRLDIHVQVLHTLNPVFARDPDRYLPIMKRLVEPERMIMFRVPWVDDGGNVQVSASRVPCRISEGTCNAAMINTMSISAPRTATHPATFSHPLLVATDALLAAQPSYIRQQTERFCLHHPPQLHAAPVAALHGH